MHCLCAELRCVGVLVQESKWQRIVAGFHTLHKCLGKYHVGLIRPGRSVDLVSHRYMLTRVTAVERLHTLPFGRMLFPPFHGAGFPQLKCIAFILLSSTLPPPPPPSSSRVPKKSTERERSKIEPSAEPLPPSPSHRQHSIGKRTNLSRFSYTI